MEHDIIEAMNELPADTAGDFNLDALLSGEDAEAAYNRPSARWAGDNRLNVQFEAVPRLDKEASLREKKVIYTEDHYIRITIPGNLTSTVYARVEDGYRARFASRYERWLKTRQNEAMGGTPISEWKEIAPSQKATLTTVGITTVEQLASMESGDRASTYVLGFEELRRKARAYTGTVDDKLTALELEKAKSETEQLKEQIKFLTEQMQSMQSNMGTKQPKV